MKSKVIEEKFFDWLDTFFSHSLRVIRYCSIEGKIERSDFGMILMSFNNPFVKEKFLVLN